MLTSRKKYFWCDEVFSWTLVTDKSLRHMFTALVQGADGAPPVFYVVARIWSLAFGTSELALRSVSCLGFIVALAVMWTIMRRAYGTWPAAIALVTVFATSQSVGYQVAEARFYGLLTALVACAVYLYAHAVWTRAFTRRLFILTALTHVALLYTHPYGAIYSAAILAAWIVCDKVQGRPWHAGYLSVIIAWLVFIPWLPSLQRVGALGKPHSWIPVPSLPDLVTAYGFMLRYFPAIVAAILAVGIIRTAVDEGAGQGLAERSTPASRNTAGKVTAGAFLIGAALLILPRHTHTLATFRDAMTGINSVAVLAVLGIVIAQQFWPLALRIRGDSGPSRSGSQMDDSMLIVGFALLGVPLVVYLMSHLGPSIFHERYLIPASLGLIPFVAHLAWWSSGGASHPGLDRIRVTIPKLAIGAACTGLVMVIAFRPVFAARHLPSQERPGTDVEAVVPPDITVVVESALDFLPLRHYQRRNDLTYTFPMDWASALAPHSWLGATVEYKILETWRRVGLLSAAELSGTQVPCAGRPFVVLHSGRYSWYADRIAGDSAFNIQTLGPSPSTFERGTILLITPRAAVTPVMCRGSLPNQPSGPTPRT